MRKMTPEEHKAHDEKAGIFLVASLVGSALRNEEIHPRSIERQVNSESNQAVKKRQAKIGGAGRNRTDA